MVAGSGWTVMWSIAAGVTCRVASSVWCKELVSVAVTVWSPATLVVQVAAVQLPLGAMAKVLSPVTSPRELANTSKPIGREAWGGSAAMGAGAGLVGKEVS